jgi:dolichol-phosphate mannosyltransferase
VKALVVIPTYNERRNVSRLVPEVLRQDPDIAVLVVDDASPDGTGEAVAEMAAAERRVHLLTRASKQGLGTAYVAGFRYALEKTDAHFVLEMDADLSHDPNAIPALLEAMATADVAVGSRYLKGVNVINWPFRRLLISYCANLYARFATGLPLSDLTSGFKCFRRRVLEAIPLERVRSDGYAFQIEMNVRAWKRGFRVREVPIVFTERAEGESKLSRRIVWEAMWMVWRLRLSR